MKVCVDNMKVLIADDSRSMRRLLENLVKEWGYQPISAQDGNEAWEILNSRNRPRIAMIDWIMPDLDGISLCRKIKQSPDLPFIYVILITSKSEQEDIVAGLDAGADDFIIKSVQATELRSRLAAGVRILGYQDELAKRNNQLADRNGELNTLFSAMPNTVCFKGGDGRWLKANESCKQLFQIGGHYQGKTSRELMANASENLKDLFMAFEELSERAYQKKGVVFEEIEHMEENGSKRFYGVVSAPLFNTTRKGVIEIGQDITYNKQLEHQLRQEARFDALTGLYNRGYLIEKIREVIQTAKRYGHFLSACMCDIDYFKSVNDEHGHNAGDQVLAAFAKTLKENLRETDICGRFGGDEFYIVLPHTSAEKAKIALERIRKAFCSQEFTGDKGEKFSATSSMGVVELKFSFGIDQLASENPDNEQDLIKQADQALYLAKKKGRNQIAVYSDDIQ